jgi:hypothetical protein
MFFLMGNRIAQAPTGSAVETGGYGSDCFRTAMGSDSNGGRTGTLCNTGEKECSGNGQCCHAIATNGNVKYLPNDKLCTDADLGGCVCDKGYTGEFCEVQVPASTAQRSRGRPGLTFGLSVLALACVLIGNHLR